MRTLCPQQHSPSGEELPFLVLKVDHQVEPRFLELILIVPVLDLEGERHGLRLFRGTAHILWEAAARSSWVLVDG